MADPGSSGEYSLRWNGFWSDFTQGFRDLYNEETMFDVTLAAEGRLIQAHKLVLSVCSPYFKNIFEVNPCKHPVVILKDVHHRILESMLNYMYKGEVCVCQDDLQAFLNLAENLKTKGLLGNVNLKKTGVKLERRTSQETKKKSSAFPSDTDETDEELVKHTKRLTKRRSKASTKNAKKQKTLRTSQDEGLRVDSSDASISRVNVTLGQSETDRTEIRDSGPAVDDDSSNCYLNDTVSNTFEMGEPMFSSENANDAADQGLQGNGKKRTKPPSVIWNYFSFCDYGVKCMGCGKELKGRRASSAIDHLALHNDLYNDFLRKKTRQMEERNLAFSNLFSRFQK